MNAQQKKFLRREFWTLSFAGAKPRSHKLYNSEIVGNGYTQYRFEKDKERFRECLREYFYEKLFPIYQKREVCEKCHYKNIKRLKRAAEMFGRKIVRNVDAGSILHENEFKIGTAQKLLNLQLKYLWCWNKIPKPPHCPIDSNVLRKVRWNPVCPCNPNCTTWTTWKCIEIYKKAIRTIREHTGGKDIAKWELEFFNDRNEKNT